MNMEGNPLPDKYNENEIFVGANYPNVKEMYFITMPLVKWDSPEKQSDNSM